MSWIGHRGLRFQRPMGRRPRRTGVDRGLLLRWRDRPVSRLSLFLEHLPPAGLEVRPHPSPRPRGPFRRPRRTGVDRGLLLRGDRPVGRLGISLERPPPVDQRRTSRRRARPRRAGQLADGLPRPLPACPRSRPTTVRRRPCFGSRPTCRSPISSARSHAPSASSCAPWACASAFCAHASPGPARPPQVRGDLRRRGRHRPVALGDLGLPELPDRHRPEHDRLVADLQGIHRRLAERLQFRVPGVRFDGHRLPRVGDPGCLPVRRGDPRTPLVVRAQRR